LTGFPSYTKALKILHEAGCSDEVVAHCKLVSRIAEDIAVRCRARGLTVDIDLVVIGGLLHDIGRSRTHSIRHGAVGAELAREMGLSEKLVLIIERHVGAGITSEEAITLGLPEKDYLPRSLEEKIVTYADKLAQGDRQAPIESEICRLSEELDPSHPAIQRLKDLHGEIQSLLEEC